MVIITLQDTNKKHLLALIFFAVFYIYKKRKYEKKQLKFKEKQINDTIRKLNLYILTEDDFQRNSNDVESLRKDEIIVVDKSETKIRRTKFYFCWKKPKKSTDLQFSKDFSSASNFKPTELLNPRIGNWCRFWW